MIPSKKRFKQLGNNKLNLLFVKNTYTPYFFLFFLIFLKTRNVTIMTMKTHA